MLAKTALFTTVIALAFGAAAYHAPAGAERPDCPGTITCPMTGAEVCRDECPMIDARRGDCPGKIECPIDGKPARSDRCPAAAEDAAATSPVRSCCAAR